MQTEIGGSIMNSSNIKYRKSASPQEQNESLSRKRCASVETQDLEAKISKETAKIIKSKVAQDAATWELKEECKELESIRERQQQNLVELQMQYEALDGEYQKELRLREDTTNKIVNTRSISNILEDHFGRLAETLSRCQNDRKTLSDAYQKVTQVIKDVKIKHAQSEEKHMTTINNLKEQVELEKNHNIQMSERWAETKKDKDFFITELKSMAGVRENIINELKKSQDDARKHFVALKAEHDTNKSDSDKKDKKIEALEHELNEVKNKYNNDMTEMKMLVANGEKELEKCGDENNSLKKALSNQDEFIKKLGAENSKLMDNIGLLEMGTFKLNTNLDEASSKNKMLTQSMQELQLESNDRIAKLMEQCKTQEQMLETGKNDMVKANEEINRLIAEVGTNQQEFVVKRQQWKDQTTAMTNEIAGLKVKCQNLELNNANAFMQVATYQNEVTDLQKTCSDERLCNELKRNEILDTIDKTKKELLAKDDTIGKLMSELKNGTDLRAKLEMNIEKSKKDTDLLRKKDKDNTFSIITLEEKLQTAIKELNITKDELKKSEDENNGLMKHVKTLKDKVNETSNELEDVKQRLAATNALVVPQLELQKSHHLNEEKYPPSSPTTPLPLSTEIVSSVKEAWVKPITMQKKTNKNNAKVTFLSPEKQMKQLGTSDLDFDFLSDSSIEGGYKMNPAEVNRRFNALKRGESIVSSMRVAPTKRRMTVHKPSQPQDYHEYSTKDDNIYSIKCVAKRVPLHVRGGEWAVGEPDSAARKSQCSTVKLGRNSSASFTERSNQAFESKLSHSQNEPISSKRKTFFRNKHNSQFVSAKKTHYISSGEDN